MQKNIVIAVIISVLVAGGGGFVLGKNSATSGASAQSARFQGQGGQLGQGNRAGNSRFNAGGVISGQVLSKDANGITVELRGRPGQDQATASGSRIVLISSSTQVMKSANGTLGDISVGTDITAMGSANTDGSMTAQSIQIRPPMLASSTPQ